MDSSRERFIEDITVIWFDQYINNVENQSDVETTKLLLRQVGTYLVFFTEPEGFFNYIQSIDKEKVLLIISGSLAMKYLPAVHPMEQIDSVFIFCMQLDKYLPLKEIYSKITGIFTHQDDLLESLVKTIDLISKQRIVFGLFDGIQRSIRYLKGESISFLWFQLLNDVLNKIALNEDPDRGMLDMLEYCQIYYRGNETELKNIREFRQKYSPEDAIFWYSKQSFLFKLVNKALRTEDIDVLYRFRTYIAHLRRRLTEEHQEFRREYDGTRSKFIRLYRGIQMNAEEILQMRNNVGGLISMNGFLSTSREKDQALRFAQKPLQRRNSVGVLIEIDGDLYSKQLIFADISQFSLFPDEKEVLFDLGSVFRIVHVEFDEKENLWLMQLTGKSETFYFMVIFFVDRLAVDESIYTSQAYIQSLGRESEDEDSILLFGRLICDMGDYDKAQRYFQRLLTSLPPNDPNIANIHFHFGRIAYFRGEHLAALEFYRHGLALQKLQITPKDKSFDIARTLHNIGMVYFDQKDISTAMKYYQEALEMKRAVLSHHPNHPSIATSLTALGSVYKRQGNFGKALEFYEEAYQMKEMALPSDHPAIAESLNLLGIVYHEMDDQDKALECFTKSLEIKEASLPENHLSISATWSHMGVVFRKKKDFSKAMACYTKALEIERISSAPDSLDIADTYHNLCVIFIDQREYQRALENARLRLEILQKHFDDDNEQIQESKVLIDQLKKEIEQTIEIWL